MNKSHKHKLLIEKLITDRNKIYIHVKKVLKGTNWIHVKLSIHDYLNIHVYE